jgi:hypothetical protein
VAAVLADTQAMVVLVELEEEPTDLMVLAVVAVVAHQ